MQLAKSDLSRPRQRLIEIMQRLNWGRIEQLVVRDGEPVLNARTRIIRNVRLGGREAARPELGKDDFLLKAPVIELFEHLDRLGNGRVMKIEIRSGLPADLVFEQPEAEGLA
ncbi:MAG TPA: hypothetical protein VE398_22095 [Acidobacteriota bacterium]|nr:hypothetical protein [Acidobacteriota bacterium]